jgi:hypothetical protein
MDVRRSPSIGDGVWLGDYQGLVPALNFDTPAVATWIDTRAGNNDPYVVRINRTKGTTFEAWRKLRFSTNHLANPAISGENADPDGDGITNLREYAFGLEPTRMDTNPLKITESASGPDMRITLFYERLAVLSDIQFAWQTSVDLMSWALSTPEQEKIVAGTDPSMQRVEASFSGSGKMQFFRLAVTRVAPTP